MMKHCRYILFVFIVSLLAVCSCNTSGCLENQSSIPLAGFYSSSTKKKVSVDSISIYAVDVPGDSMLVRVGRGVSQVYMPLDITADETRYVLHYDAKDISDERLNDTIKILYDRVPYFVSNECGAMYFFDVKDHSYTFHLVDSVAITTTRFTNVDVETIQIFMRTEQ